MALDPRRDAAFLALVDGDSYYRTRPLDEHETKGGTDTVKRGFAACGLPLVLAHNCPNNSVYLLWADHSNERAHEVCFRASFVTERQRSGP